MGSRQFEGGKKRMKYNWDKNHFFIEVQVVATTMLVLGID
jgi:hypothetical protein